MIFSKLLAVLGFFQLLSPTFAWPHDFNCPDRRGPRAIQARVPPLLNEALAANVWRPPPPGWYFKAWNMIYASNPQYAFFRNFQYDPTAVNPSQTNGQVHDLASFQIPNNDTVFTTYGVDTPHGNAAAVLNYAGTGILTGATSQYSLLAWGCDSNNVPYYASYSTDTAATNTPAGIDIFSVSDQGLDQATADALIAALKALPKAEIATLANALNKTIQDGGRNGQLRVNTCDDYCKSNQDLLGILG